MTKAQKLAGLILCGFLSGADFVYADAVTDWNEIGRGGCQRWAPGCTTPCRPSSIGMNR
jgi:hypothetical protein